MDSEQLYRAALETTRSEPQNPLSTTASETPNPNPPNAPQQSVINRSVSGERSIIPVEPPGAIVDSLPALVNFLPTFPSHKRIPGTRFVVDGFRVAGAWSHSYFLTHFHSDHYQGITDNWRKGVIFCSETTARMVAQVLEVPGPFIVPLPMDQEVEIDGCGVSLVDANHCPGAIQFLFRVPGDPEKRYVHCGDMRYCRAMVDNPSITRFVGADAVYLDTTYCNPRYVFPPQEDSVEYVAATIAARMQEWRTECEAWLKDHPENPASVSLTFAGERQSEIAGGKLSGKSEGNGGVGNDRAKMDGFEAADEGNKGEQKTSPSDGMELAEVTPVSSALAPGENLTLLERVLAQPVGSSDCPRPPLFIISTYVIGKEKILSAVAARCGCKIYVDDRKVGILRCLGLPDLSIFTTDPSRSNVHVVGWGFLGDAWPFFRSNFANMEQALTDRGYEEAVGFVPTGWTYELKRKAFPTREKGRCKIHLVPYSEHSNYAELREYVSFLKPKQIIPTVGVDEKGMDGKAVAAMRKHFRNLVDETAGKRRFLRSFQKSASGKKSPEPVLSGEPLPLASDPLPLVSEPAPEALPLLEGPPASNPPGQKADTCQDPTGQTEEGVDEAEDDTDVDEEMDDPDYVASEGDSDDLKDTPVPDGRRDEIKMEGLGSGCTSTAEYTSIGRQKGSPAGRLTPVLTRRVKRKVEGENDDVRAQKRPTFDLRVKSQEGKVPAESVEAEQQKNQADMELERKVSSGVSWLQAHKQALQGATTTGTERDLEPGAEGTESKLDAGDNKEDKETDTPRTGGGRSEKLEREKIEQLRGILPGLTAQKAGVLLARAGGDVAGALTWFYDGGGPQEGGLGNENEVGAGGLETQAEKAEGRDDEQNDGLTDGTQAGARAGNVNDVTFGKVTMSDVIADSAPGVEIPRSDLGDDAGDAFDRKDRTADASTSGQTAGNPSGKPGEGLRSPPNTSRTAGKDGEALRSPTKSSKGAQSPAAKRRAPAGRSVTAGNKKGKVDRQQPLILSFFGGGKKEVLGVKNEGVKSEAGKSEAVKPEPVNGDAVGSDAVNNEGVDFEAMKSENVSDLDRCEHVGVSAGGNNRSTKTGSGSQPGEEKSEAGISPEDYTSTQSTKADVTKADVSNANVPNADVVKAVKEEPGDDAKETAKMTQLLSVLGGEVSTIEAVSLLGRAGGDVNRAVDWFYNGRGTVPGDMATLVPGKRIEVTENGSNAQMESEGAGRPRTACNERNGSPAEGTERNGTKRNANLADPRRDTRPSLKMVVKDEPGLEDFERSPGREGLSGAVEERVKGELKSEVNGEVKCGVEGGTEGGVVKSAVNGGTEDAGKCRLKSGVEGGVKSEVKSGVNDGTEEQEQKGEMKGKPKGNLGSVAAPERQLGGVVATGKVGAGEGDRTAVTLSLAKYNPVGNACWKNGEAAPYLHLARTFEVLERERGRLKMADILCNMFRSLLALSPADILPAVYLSTNRVAPDFENVDMSIGGSTVGAAIAEATGTSKAQMRELYNSLGDLGDVALACKQRQATLMAPPPLRVAQVYGALRKISKETGPGCNNRKKNIVLGLLRACREKETQFVVRTLVLNMRIGAMMKTVLPALAQAVFIHKSLPSDRPAGLAINGLKAKLQEASAAMVEAYNFCPNLDVLVPVLVEGGIEAVVAQGAVALGTPIKPMLAKITNGIPEILKRFQGQAFTAEFKYDGQRAQIHLLPDGSVKIFSRNCDDNTGRFPDVIDTVKQAAKGGCSSFIIDAELVAVDRSAGNRLMAFQTLSTRARGGEKTKIEIADVRIAVCVFAFDLLYVDGSALVKEPFRERRRLMREAFPAHSNGHFEFAREVTVEAADARQESEPTSALLQSFLQEAFSSSCEGMMVKALDTDAGYAASKRSDSWLKVKKDYIDGLNDSLDLVPIGAWYGQGRKVGWFSPFLLACYDPEREEYQSVCRVMSGFTDVFYKETSHLYRDERLLDQKPPYYRTLEQPDVWFRPHDVWEIRGADLTVSPVHAAAAGLVHPTRGISMRFPRMIKPRPDKKPEDASPPPYIADLFHRQTRKLDLAPVQEQETKRSPKGALPLFEEEGERNESGEESDGDEGRGGRKPPAGLDD